MSREFTVDAPLFASVLVFTTDPCSSQFQPGEIPDWQTDATGCAHWIETVWCVKAADMAIDQVVNERVADGATISLSSLIDDFCGTPPRWPLPWPKASPLKDDHLSAATLLMVASRLQMAADHVRAEGEQPEIDAAANRLFDVGFERLAEEGSGYA
jgi:hypothetical protein